LFTFWPAGEAKSNAALTVPNSYECKSAEIPEKQRVMDSEEGMKETVRRVFLMGTVCTIQLYSPDSKTALKQIESFILQLEKTEEELSTWKETSVLSRLNRQPIGIPFEISESFQQLFETLQYWSQLTDNTFDPTVGKLLTAYGYKTGGRWPDSEAIEAAKTHKGMHFYSLDGSGQRITKTGDIEIDCGAFGKGEALDRLLNEDVGNSRWIVNLGGQIFVNGSPPDKDGWLVNISHPQNRQNGLFAIRLRSGSLATSGGSERDVEVDNHRLGHIMDPNTGKPAEFSGSVSVWHERALVADILSTALYVMGPEKGLSWAESRNIAACFLVPDKDGRIKILSSHIFRNMFL
ncbi:MAG: FAD:protein FMN transferase, partial [Acidobacteriota bacterium]